MNTSWSTSASRRAFSNGVTRSRRAPFAIQASVLVTRSEQKFHTQVRSFSATARRNTVFDLPLLLQPNDSHLQQNGIPGLYSPAGFKMAWTDWQTHLVDGLNQRISEAPSGSTKQINIIRNLIRAHARSSDGPSPAIFNYASSAWNNEFFFRGLNYGLEDDSTEIPQPLLTKLELDFFSLANLKAEFLNHASTMFAGGFVWLIRRHKSSRLSPGGPGHHGFSILRTYSSGSPLPEAHFRAQLSEARSYDSVLGGERSKSMQWAKDIADQGTLDVWPVLGVSVWEHSYLTDYGVAGRDEYLEKWWKCINWPSVLTEVQSEELARERQSRQTRHN